MRKKSSICIKSVIKRNLSTKITERDDFQTQTYSGFGMEELDRPCKVLSLKKSSKSISRQVLPERNPVKKLEKRVEEMEQVLAKKQKYFARKLNKLKNKLKVEEDIQQYLSSQIKCLNLEMHKQNQLINKLQKEVNTPEQIERAKKPKNKGKMFKKVSSIKSINRNSLIVRSPRLLH